MSEKKFKNGVHYWIHDGPKQGRTLLFIHGFTGSHEGFQYMLPLLPDFTCVVPDLPGFGESDLWEDTWTIPELARRINSFTRSLNLEEPPVLVGHSMGGLVVAAMLDDDPELYSHEVILISPVAERIKLLSPRKLGAVFGSLQYFAGSRIPRVGPPIVKSKLISRNVTRMLTTTSDKSLKKAIRHHHYKNLDYISSYAFYHQLHKDITARGVLDYEAALLGKRILIITGSKDTVTPLKSEKMLAGKLGAELVVVPNVGHLIQYEKPRQATDAISAFLSQ